MNLSVKDIAFPILIYGPSGWLSIYNTPNEMVECKRYVKHFPKNGTCRILSNDLKSYLVMEFIDVGGVRPFFGIRLGGPLLFQRFVQFDLLLKFDCEKSISDVVDIYCRDIEYGCGFKGEFRRRLLERMEDSLFSVSKSYSMHLQLLLELRRELEARKLQRKHGHY